VRLPLPEGRSGSERASLSVADAGNQNKLSTRVLVVDDNKNHVESIAMLLKILGCEVRTARGGPSALKALTEFSPEFALIDIGLPGIDGFELARRIRKMTAFKNIILIAQTGWGSDEDRKESRQAGFNYHLIKPLDFQVLEMILTGGASNSLVL
jgi:CheY-like chemotaxis protein